jgi:hypothetical protein
MSRHGRVHPAGVVAAAYLAAAWCVAAQDIVDPAAPAAAPRPAPVAAALAAAPDLEQSTLGMLMRSDSWPRRAVAALRMERYTCDASRHMLVELLRDRDWQVRAFATYVLARRGVPLGAGWFADEHEPRVIRTALRCRCALDVDRIASGVRALSRSAALEDKLLGAELAVTTGDAELGAAALENVRKVILRMGRAEAGTLSPRLAVLTGQRDLRRHYRWQDWLLKTGRGLELRPGWLVPEGHPGAAAPPAPLRIAQLDGEAFATLEGYMQTLAGRHVDLAICLDCTASMYAELADAQGGIDNLMLFVGDVVDSLRVAIVGYRDHRDEFETKAWDFTPHTDEARRRLWQLEADGGGDGPESVHKALQVAYTELSWDPHHSRMLILVGDAPPHVGRGTRCVEMAEAAARSQLTTHVIQAEGKDVKHFAEIARAGGGRCVSLEDNASLIPELAGLTLGERFGEEFREFFALYLALCR